MVVAVDHPLGTQRDPRLGQALGEPRTAESRGRRQPRLAAEKPGTRPHAEARYGEISSAVGVTESVITRRQGAVAGERSNSTTGSCSLSFLIVGIAVHTRGDYQAVDLAGDHVIDHHALLAWVFVGAGDKQLHAGFPAERLKLVGENGKPVVGDLRHHQTNGMAAVIAQRARVNARLIVLFASDRQVRARASPAPRAALYHDR